MIYNANQPRALSESTNSRWQLPRIYLTDVRILRYKVDQLIAVLENNQTDNWCKVESRLDEINATDSIDIINYTGYRRGRADGRRCGGVVCYISDQWPCTRLKFLETPEFESIWLLLRRPVVPRQVSYIALGAIYHQPGAPSGAMVLHIISAVNAIISQHPHPHPHPHARVIIVGHLNTTNSYIVTHWSRLSVYRLGAKQFWLKYTPTLKTGIKWDTSLQASHLVGPLQCFITDANCSLI